jgi:hypothetical protein
METTFTPLSRGRFRCNTTGKIVKRARTKAHRNQLYSQDRSPPPPIVNYTPPPRQSYYSYEPPRESREVQAIWSILGRYYYCPTCYRDAEFYDRLRITCKCGQALRCPR